MPSTSPPQKNQTNKNKQDITLRYDFEGQHCEAHRTQRYRMR
jgi:hypothetical protein